MDRSKQSKSTHVENNPQNHSAQENSPTTVRSEHARVGAIIREARERANLSLQELADRVGCVKSYLSAIETDRRSLPGDDVLARVESALGLAKGRLVHAARWQKSLEVGGVAVQRDLAEMQKQQVAAKRLASLLHEFRGRDGDANKGARKGKASADANGASDSHSSPLDAAYLSGELAKLVDQISPPPANAANVHGRFGVGSGLRGDAIVPVPLPLEVPLINSVAAGYPTEFTDLGYPARVADEYVRLPGRA
ncbi:MAG: helix-turn-helix transcriptional regulator [Phycisphaerales bacterium]